MTANPHAERQEREHVVVRAPVAPLHSEDRVTSPQISQLLAGARLEILDIVDEWLHVRGPDGYEGWMNRGFVAAEGARGTGDLLSLGCTVRGADGQHRVLPLGAYLGAGDELVVGEAITEEERQRRFPPDPVAIVRSGMRFFEGTSYQWGGVTPLGADCSGFTQSVFGLHGIWLPRDAWQQALVGAAAGSDIDALQAADLMFFSDRSDQRITHVGIATGDRGMVHLALGRGGYSVERLDDRTDPYIGKVRHRFLFARRMPMRMDPDRGQDVRVS
jgi:gamma-D-glutamyl-L-lysine dipeptidyl-peptidase